MLRSVPGTYYLLCGAFRASMSNETMWTFQDVCTPVLHATRLFVQRKKHGVQQMNCTVQPINLNQPLTAFREEIHFTVNHEAA